MSNHKTPMSCIDLLISSSLYMKTSQHSRWSSQTSYPIMEGFINSDPAMVFQNTALFSECSSEASISTANLLITFGLWLITRPNLFYLALRLLCSVKLIPGRITFCLPKKCFPKKTVYVAQIPSTHFPPHDPNFRLNYPQCVFEIDLLILLPALCACRQDLKSMFTLVLS